MNAISNEIRTLPGCRLNAAAISYLMNKFPGEQLVAIVQKRKVKAIVNALNAQVTAGAYGDTQFRNMVFDTQVDQVRVLRHALDRR